MLLDLGKAHMNQTNLSAKADYLLKNNWNKWNLWQYMKDVFLWLGACSLCGKCFVDPNLQVSAQQKIHFAILRHVDCR